ncbi:REP-associated tyrosine transposase [Sinimarinibacterium flocculans]|uniref:REP-associated tyrosine transposase n=1 Tax=Sinimarinibacterium flocculans TaxID=985250 RepID=UPI003511CFC0
MPRYIRARIPGGTFFLSVALLERRRRLLVEHVDVLRAAFRKVRRRYPFTIDAIVILPDHFHTVWTLPPGDADFSTRMRLIKSTFSRALPATEHLSAVRSARGERGVWQRRFWEHAIRDEDDLRLHLDYTHYNPVKHGHVRQVREWPHSSFHRYVEAGMYPPDWGGTVAAMNDDRE